MGNVTNVRTRIFETGDAAGSAWLSTTVTHHVPEMAGELVSFLAPESQEADQYRALRYAIEERHQGAGLQVIGVTSRAGRRQDGHVREPRRHAGPGARPPRAPD